MTLAGSALSLDAAVRNFYEMSGCSVADALTAATLRPAQLLGIASKKGTLTIGADADLLLLSPDLQITATYIAGHPVYTQE